MSRDKLEKLTEFQVRQILSARNIPMGIILPMGNFLIEVYPGKLETEYKLSRDNLEKLTEKQVSAHKRHF